MPPVMPIGEEELRGIQTEGGSLLLWMPLRDRDARLKVVPSS